MRRAAVLGEKTNIKGSRSRIALVLSDTRALLTEGAKFSVATFKLGKTGYNTNIPTPCALEPTLIRLLKTCKIRLRLNRF